MIAKNFSEGEIRYADEFFRWGNSICIEKTDRIFWKWKFDMHADTKQRNKITFLTRFFVVVVVLFLVLSENLWVGGGGGRPFAIGKSP